MPRSAREKSSTGIYHVMFRGINGQTIFNEEEDYERFIKTIKDYKEVCGYEIYAFCLMPNHVHLLIKEGKEELGIAFRRIGASYVFWYNWKYIRSGHLFQDRFKSEVVEDEKYFLTVLRYIHQNPIKAGIADDMAKYRWSSYNEYLGDSDVCNTRFALGFFDDNEKSAKQLFIKFNNQENNDICLEYKEKVRINDIEAKKMIIKIAGVKNPNQVKELDRVNRDRILKELKHAGLSIRQIERLTGIKFSIIRKI